MENNKKLKVLVACEESQVIMKEFRKLGHDAYSNDIIDCSGDLPYYHIKIDCLDAIKINNWDLLIAHPPCTYLSYCNTAKWDNEINAKNRVKAADLFLNLYFSDIPHICIENPQGIMTKFFKKPNQIIHPYYFGEPELKRTCLWLKNLPVLIYSKDDNLFEKKTVCNKPEPSFVWKNKVNIVKKEYFTYSKNSKHRSKSFQSIAAAMAVQWSDYICKPKS
jgi:hypothetical protein